MLVQFTGDHPAQCKFGGFASSGYSACRRCKMNASLHVQHGPNSRPGGVVVYDCNRSQYRHPPARKTVIELRQAVLELNACTTSAARKEVSQRTGVVADSNVWKLYDLYGFNPSLDLTYDAMHVLALSMFKKYTELLKKDSERTSAGCAGELLDDVRRHGPSHVYWCYSFERLVSSYNKIKTNSRHMETTFTSHYEVPTRVTLLKSTMVKATFYGPGDYAFVKSDSSDMKEGSWHWKTKISRIFAHSCRGYIQIFFEGTWFFNSITKSGRRDFCRFNPISDMELLDQHTRVAFGDNCRPVHLLECHFFPVQQKKHGDNHILAIPTGPYTRHSTMFGEGGVGHPLPQPEVDDVMLVAHSPNCSTKFLKHCVVTEVQNTAAGSVLDEGDEDATERRETSIIVKVLWLRRTVPGQWEINGGRRCCRTMQVAQLRQRMEGFTRLSGNKAWTYNPV
ncbi:hypothetical protein R1sor_009143 [Riccia sorocarpa]|uniref:Uncharacterized protein n=1 Tax=Riccia sorocarpa TaxID=122646 RepID=A0ABD3HAZ0_9MARC